MEIQYQILKKEGATLQSLYEPCLWWPGETHDNNGAGVRTFPSKRIARRVRSRLQHEMPTDDLVVMPVEVTGDGKPEQWRGFPIEIHPSARMPAKWMTKSDARLLATIVPVSVLAMVLYFWPQLSEWFW